jgi:hypothetical protein
MLLDHKLKTLFYVKVEKSLIRVYDKLHQAKSFAECFGMEAENILIEERRGFFIYKDYYTNYKRSCLYKIHKMEQKYPFRKPTWEKIQKGDKNGN